MNYQTSSLNVILMALCLASSISASSPSEKKGALSAVSSGANQFATNFFKTAATTNLGNFITSPLSVDVALSMAALGAKGNTEKELQSVLHLPADKSVAKSGYQSLIDTLNNIKGVTLHVANKVFIANGFKIIPEFDEITKTYFRSEAQNLDFASATDQSAKTINEWCQKNTNNLIKELVTADDIKDTSLVLVNAIYFKGKWTRKFDPTRTKPGAFHVNSKLTKQVPMMQNTGSYHWGSLDDLNAKFIELPYESKNANEAISMFIIVPNEIEGLANVEKNLHKVNFRKLPGSPTNVELSLPKFKIESTSNLGEILEKMGIRDAFTDSANFHGISPGINVKISKVIQKALIEVNEEGSEATTATGIQLSRVKSAHINAINPFIVNKPFVAVVTSKASGIQLLNARIVDPTSA